LLATSTSSQLLRSHVVPQLLALYRGDGTSLAVEAGKVMELLSGPAAQILQRSLSGKAGPSTAAAGSLHAADATDGSDGGIAEAGKSQGLAGSSKCSSDCKKAGLRRPVLLPLMMVPGLRLWQLCLANSLQAILTPPGWQLLNHVGQQPTALQLTEATVATTPPADGQGCIGCWKWLQQCHTAAAPIMFTWQGQLVGRMLQQQQQ